jgi:hypothetical protein
MSFVDRSHVESTYGTASTGDVRIGSMGKADNGLRLIFRQYMREGMFWTTVETGLTAAGVPDSNYLARGGIEGWLELKACEANAVKVRAEQIGWHSRRARYGGRSWFGIRKQHAGGKRLGVAIDELYMVAGCYAQELSEEGLDCGRALFMGGGGPPCWQWRKAHGLLIGKIVVR